MTRIKNLQLKNIRIVYGDIRNKLSILCQDGELETVYINFPDPWPKKRHIKRRLIKPEFVNQLAQKLDLEGTAYLATDSESYAYEMLDYFNSETLFQNLDDNQGFIKERIDLPKSKYEKNFINAGEKIFYLEYLRLAAMTSIAWNHLERRLAKERILIVDDEKNIVSSLTSILADEGYEVSIASDGIEALELIQ